MKCFLITFNIVEGDDVKIVEFDRKTSPRSALESQLEVEFSYT